MSLSEQQKRELDGRLETIDDKLTKKHVPIPSRALVTSLIYQNDLGAAFIFPSEISDYINKWHATKYGSIKNSPPIGLFIVCVAGHVFAVELPIILGQRAIQPLKHVKGLTKEIWQSQNEENQRRIEETVF